MTPQRTRIGRWTDIATRTFVYKTDYGIEVDELDRFEIIRRRVFFDDVLMVTYHRQPATSAAILITILMLFVAVISIVLLPDSTRAAIAVGAVACAIGVFAILVYMRGVDVVTVFGKRSKAAVRYLWRKERARRIYGEICAAAAVAQRQRASEIAASEPPEIVAEVELPPSPEEPLEAPAVEEPPQPPPAEEEAP